MTNNLTEYEFRQMMGGTVAELDDTHQEYDAHARATSLTYAPIYDPLQEEAMQRVLGYWKYCLPPDQYNVEEEEAIDIADMTELMKRYRKVLESQLLVPSSRYRMSSRTQSAGQILLKGFVNAMRPIIGGLCFGFFLLALIAAGFFAYGEDLLGTISALLFGVTVGLISVLIPTFPR